jgi:hypothetical protein
MEVRSVISDCCRSWWWSRSEDDLATGVSSTGGVGVAAVDRERRVLGAGMGRRGAMGVRTTVSAEVVGKSDRRSSTPGAGGTARSSTASSGVGEGGVTTCATMVGMDGTEGLRKSSTSVARGTGVLICNTGQRVARETRRATHQRLGCQHVLRSEQALPQIRRRASRRCREATASPQQSAPASCRAISSPIQLTSSRPHPRHLALPTALGCA